MLIETASNILGRIIAQKRHELACANTPFHAFEQQAEQMRSGRRDFRASLRSRTPAIIGELKKASPSRGVLTSRYDPVGLAREYQAGGAAAISVLTDETFFQGSLADLVAAREAVELPVLRKDFTIDEYHVVQAAAHGADAILLIAAVLDETRLRCLRELAAQFDMAAIVEVHDRAELQKALGAGADTVGVNNRDLNTFQVRIDTSLELANWIPAHVLKVSESGIRSAADIRRLNAAGFQAFLVGEHLMQSGNPVQALRELAGSS